jgi:hypothetical protein
MTAAPTSGTVTVTETLPAGLTLVSMSGAGWTCGSVTCTRNDALAGGNSYSAITVTVNVTANASSPQVNQVNVAGGGSATANASDSTIVNPGNPSSSSATFVKLDATTQGNWLGKYGSEGYTVVGDLTLNPAYVTPVPAGQSQWIWTSSTSDVRALQAASNPSNRLAATWYASSFTVDLNIADSNTHQLALYSVDWDSAARRQAVDILDGNGNVLNTQNLTSSFNGGVYLVWNVSGHVKIRVTQTAGANAVLTGLFFGGAGNPSSSSATFVKLDATTQGNWLGKYGSEGYTVVGDLTLNPGYVTPLPVGQSQFVWVSTTGDVRGLQKASNPSSRVAGTWYANSFTVDLNIIDSNPHQLAVYCVDWDSTVRRQTVDILDANGVVLNTQSLASSFNGGVYLVWNVSGHVKIRVTRTGGDNAVLSGLFFH